MQDNGPSDTKNDELNNFSAISEALSGGDFEALDRLMAVKAGEESKEDVKEKKEESQSEEDTPKPDEDGKQDDVSSDPPEAAKAASPEQDEIQALKAELHRLRSDAGRVPHLQRSIQELQRQLRAPEARTPNPDPKTPKTKEIPEELRKKIDSLKEIDPDLADTFDAFAKAMVNTAEQEASQVKQTFEEYQQEQENLRFYQEQKAELYKMVPRCDEIFGMDEWHEWKNNLTPGQRALTESGYANDMAHAIYAFANHMRARQQANGFTPQAASSEGGDPNNTNAAAPQANSEVVEARARKVGTAAEVKNSAAKKETELDGDALFREFYNKLAKENHIK